jgi:hypothetical protein
VVPNGTDLDPTHYAHNAQATGAYRECVNADGTPKTQGLPHGTESEQKEYLVGTTSTGAPRSSSYRAKSWSGASGDDDRGREAGDGRREMMGKGERGMAIG